MAKKSKKPMKPVMRIDEGEAGDDHLLISEESCVIQFGTLGKKAPQQQQLPLPARTQSAPPNVPENDGAELFPPVDSSSQTPKQSPLKAEIKGNNEAWTANPSVQPAVTANTPSRDAKQIPVTPVSIKPFPSNVANVAAFVPKDAGAAGGMYFNQMPPPHSPGNPPPPTGMHYPHQQMAMYGGQMYHPSMHYSSMYRPYIAPPPFIPPTATGMSPQVTPREKKVLKIIDPTTLKEIDPKADIPVAVPQPKKVVPITSEGTQKEQELQKEPAKEPEVTKGPAAQEEPEAAPKPKEEAAKQIEEPLKVEAEEVPKIVVDTSSSVKYPDGIIGPETPSPGGRTVYSIAFLLQFQDVCTAKAEDFLIDTEERPRRGGKMSRTPSQGSIGKDIRRSSSGAAYSGGSGRMSRQGSKSGFRGQRMGSSAGGSQTTLLPEDIAPLVATENRWQRPVNKDEEDAMLLKLTGLMNKLTFEKFDTLTEQITSTRFETNEILGKFVGILFDKALDEPNFAGLYSLLCVRLTNELRSEEEPAESNVPEFRRSLMNRCQKEFHTKVSWSKSSKSGDLMKAEDGGETTGEQQQQSAEALPAAPSPAPVGNSSSNSAILSEGEYLRIKMKRRGLGLVRFIGELFKVKLLSEKIIHQCFVHLLSNIDDPEEEEVESLCKLMTTVGGDVDHKAAQTHMDIYFDRIQQLSQNMKLSSRVRFALLDVLDLRKSGWVKRDGPLTGPKKLGDLHREIALKSKQQQVQQQQGSSARRSARGGGSVGSSRGGSVSSAPPVDEWRRPSAAKRQDSKGKVVLKRSPEPVKSISINKFQMLESKRDEDEEEEQQGETADEEEQTEAQAEAPKEISASDAERSSRNLINEYLQHHDRRAAQQYLSESIPTNHHALFVSVAISSSLEEKRSSVVKVAELFRFLFDEAQLSKQEILAGFSEAFEMLEDLSIDIPHAFEYAGILLGHALAGEALGLTEMFDSILQSLSPKHVLEVLAETLLTCQDLIGIAAALRLVDPSKLRASSRGDDALLVQVLKKNQLLAFLPPEVVRQRLGPLVTGSPEEYLKEANALSSNSDPSSPTVDSGSNAVLLTLPLLEHLRKTGATNVAQWKPVFEQLVGASVDAQMQLLEEAKEERLVKALCGIVNEDAVARWREEMRA